MLLPVVLLCPGKLKKFIDNPFQPAQLLYRYIQRLFKNLRIMFAPTAKQRNMPFNDGDRCPQFMGSIFHELLLVVKGGFELIHQIIKNSRKLCQLIIVAARNAHPFLQPFLLNAGHGVA
ncbi:hypothetical protein D3C75_1053460 [compost metagenome]